MLEVCVDSIESAFQASEGGASRLELCSALSEGGLTPTCGLLKTIKKYINPKIPIFVMLRPRRGNDFIYSDMEMECILTDLKNLSEAGADGFVFGALNLKQEINSIQCSSVILAAKRLPVTFNRAFDLTKKENMLENCELITSLGFKRILTSGFESSAILGIENIKNLISNVGENIIIMPGAGINSKNIRKIIEETNCKEFHASAISTKISNNKVVTSISMGGTTDFEPIMVTNKKLVQELISLGKNELK